MSSWQMSSKIKVKLLTDVLLLVSALLLASTRLTGLVVHEWLGLLVILPLLVHLLLNWVWLRTAFLGLLRRMSGEMRANVLINATFFTTMTGTIVSGVLISEVVLPTIGLPRLHDPTLRWLHSFSADVMLVVLGLHLGMKWRWLQRLASNLLRSPQRRPAGAGLALDSTSRLSISLRAARTTTGQLLAARPIPAIERAVNPRAGGHVA